MAEFVYTMQNVRKAYPGREVIKDLTLAFLPGAKIGILGANGAGKSTLLKIMAGVDEEYTGEAQAGKGVRVGYLPQEPELDPDKTVRENVEEGVAPVRDLLQEFEAVSARFAEPMEDDEMNELLEKQGELQDQIDAVGGWELENLLDRAMDALRCPPPDSPVVNLSGGERRRVALCRILLEKPDLLLLDEPTNHLDAESVAWLEHHLAEYPGCVVAVTHDRYFLDNVAGWILELDRGQGIPWKGNYSSWLEQKSRTTGAGGEAGLGPSPNPGAGARLDPPVAPRTPGQEQGAHQEVRRVGQRRPAGQAAGHRDSNSTRAPSR